MKLKINCFSVYLLRRKGFTPNKARTKREQKNICEHHANNPLFDLNPLRCNR